MKKQKQENKKDIIIIILCIFISTVIGIYSGDILVGGSLLIAGLLSSYLASIGKKSSYVFGFINALLMAYVAYKNNLFGSFIVNAFIFAPLEIYGFVSWSHNLDKKKNVKIRKFTIKDSATVIGACVFSSVILGYLLTLIPYQQMAFLDSTINCIDICALILMNLRFKESWWLWILSSLLSIIMWSIAFANGGDNAFMRMVASTGFLIIEVYGVIKWSLNKKIKTKRF